MLTIHFLRFGRTTLLFSIGLGLFADAAGAGQTRVAPAASPDLVDVMRSVGSGDSLRIEATPLEDFSQTAGLDLVRFEPLAPNAPVVVQTDSGPQRVHLQTPVYLRGSVDGMRGSLVALSVRPSGEVRGVVSGADGTWMLSRGVGSKDGLTSRRVRREAMKRSRDFSCDVLSNPTPLRTGSTAPVPQAEQRSQRLPISYTAKVAVELDYEFYQTFGDADAAILYALDLMAFTGVIGESELGMNVQVPYLQLWTTSFDPYSGGNGRLDQLRNRWNEFGATNCGGGDCSSIGRSTVILLSSAPTGGVAYSPALCDSYHSLYNGYSYAYAGSIEGNFNIDAPTAVWDIVVTAHELGHNFGTGHTHCYSPPIDGCYASDPGCYAGVPSYPAGCPGSAQGCGTIMSYCHLLSGGEANIALTYGAGHPYGNTPDRVPTAMINRIALEAADAPGCLTATGGMVELEVTKAGSGGGVVTSAPAALNCGSACRTYFGAGTVVTLTATANGFSNFVGWSGDADCSDGVVTLSAATSCVANFQGNCGVGNENCDDDNPCTLDTCPADDHCENQGSPRPSATCFEAAKSKVKFTNDADNNRDKLQWQWKGGDAFDQADLGDPTVSTDYTLCVYDSTGSTSSLATSLFLPAGSSLWRSYTTRGWTYSDRSASLDGVKKLQLRTGVAGKTKVKLNSVGALLPMPTAFSPSKLFDADPSVVLQLVADDDRCWTSSFGAAGVQANTSTVFRAAGN